MEKEKKKILGFSKEKILESKKYQKNRDALSALLEEDKKYSYKQVDDILKNFYQKEVK
jgi:hypothetical protein